MGDTILLRRGTAANLPDLQVGEPGFATDTKVLYIGAGAGTAEDAAFCTSTDIDAIQYEPNTFTQATIEAALAAIGTANKVTLLLRPENWVILTALAFPANVTVKMPAGAYFSGAAVTAGTVTGLKDVTPEMFGVNTVPGTTDMTKAINAALASGGNVTLQKTTYAVDTILIPETSSTGSKFIGAGMGNTILQSRTTNTVMFQKASGAGIYNKYYFADFSVKAHASGSTGGAFKLTGAQDNVFERISYLSNAGGNYAYLFDLAAHPYACYGNRFVDITVDSQTGPTYVWHFNNNSMGEASNANVQYIIRPWIYNNTTGMTRIVDGQSSYGVIVRDGFFEGNTLAAAIHSGWGMIIAGNYFEGNLANSNIVYALDAVNGSSLSGTVRDNCFVDAQTIDFPAGLYGNVWINNVNSINTTFTGDGRNLKLNLEYLEATVDVVVPTLARSAGQTGTPGAQSTVKVSNFNIDGEFSATVRLPWTPSGAGTTTFLFPALAGYALKMASFGAYDTVTGTPSVTSQVITAEGSVIVVFSTTNLHNIDAWVIYGR